MKSTNKETNGKDPMQQNNMGHLWTLARVVVYFLIPLYFTQHHKYHQRVVLAAVLVLEVLTLLLDTTVCSEVIKAAASTMASTVWCGPAPWPPLPLTSMRKRSLAAITGPSWQ